MHGSENMEFFLVQFPKRRDIQHLLLLRDEETWKILGKSWSARDLVGNSTSFSEAIDVYINRQ